MKRKINEKKKKEKNEKKDEKKKDSEEKTKRNETSSGRGPRAAPHQRKDGHAAPPEMEMREKQYHPQKGSASSTSEQAPSLPSPHRMKERKAPSIGRGERQHHHPQGQEAKGNITTPRREGESSISPQEEER